MAKPDPIPKGYTTVTASMIFRDAPKAIEFYKKAFGATERARALGPDGKIMHAEIQIGSSIVMLSANAPPRRSAPRLSPSISTSRMPMRHTRRPWRRARSR